MRYFNFVKLLYILLALVAFSSNSLAQEFQLNGQYVYNSNVSSLDVEPDVFDNGIYVYDAGCNFIHCGVEKRLRYQPEKAQGGPFFPFEIGLVAAKGLGRVQSRVNVANGPTRFTPLRNSGQPVSAGFEHVLGGHFGRALGNNRSIFSISPSDLKSVLQSKTVVNSPVTSLGGGQFSRTVDVGRTIGNASLNQGGAATSRLRVLTDSAGNLITTFPVK